MVTKSEFAALRSELSILEKADFALLKTDIHAIEKRLDTSVAEIYTAVEKVENRVIKWVIAVAGAIGLGIIRLMSTSGSSGGGGSGSGGGSGGVYVPRPPTANISHRVDYNKNAGADVVESGRIEEVYRQQQHHHHHQQRRQDDGQPVQQQQQQHHQMHAQMSHDVRQCRFDGHLPDMVARRRCRAHVDMVHT